MREFLEETAAASAPSQHNFHSKPKNEGSAGTSARRRASSSAAATARDSSAAARRIAASAASFCRVPHICPLPLPHPVHTS